MNKAINPWLIDDEQKYDIIYKHIDSKESKNTAETKNILARGVSRKYTNFIINNWNNQDCYKYRSYTPMLKRESKEGKPIYNIQNQQESFTEILNLTIDLENRIEVSFDAQEEIDKSPFGKYHEITTEVLLSYEKIFNYSCKTGELGCIQTYNKQLLIDIRSRDINGNGSIETIRNNNLNNLRVPENVSKFFSECISGETALIFSNYNNQCLSTREALVETERFRTLCKQLYYDIKNSSIYE